MYLNIDGNISFEKVFLYAGDYKDGIACVKKINGKVVHINSQGEEINGKEFLDLGIFHKNFATARDNGGWHHIDMDGAQVYKERYLAIEPFYNGYAYVETFEHQKLVIDEKGNVIIKA